jgi:hypothetical protein
VCLPSPVAATATIYTPACYRRTEVTGWHPPGQEDWFDGALAKDETHPVSWERFSKLRRANAFPVLAIILTLVVFATDWPLNWGFWFDHPAAAAVSAGLAVLFLTVSVVDAFFRRREAQRWRALGRAAANDLRDVFFLAQAALFSILGGRWGMRVWSDIQSHVDQARDRAYELLEPMASTPDGEAAILADDGRYANTREQRIPILALDMEWRDSTVAALLMVMREHHRVMAQWGSVFGVVRDDEGFTRMAQSMAISDYVEAVLQQLMVVQDADVEGRPFSPQERGPALDALVRHWTALQDALFAETGYWNQRLINTSTLSLDALPVSAWEAKSPGLPTDSRRS